MSQPMNSLIKAHVAIASVWIVLALILALKVALLGNEEISLKKGRGADLKSRTDMAYQVERSKNQLDYEASGPALDDAIRTLGLPLAAPTKVASR
jgi:hypothetical protein